MADGVSITFDGDLETALDALDDGIKSSVLRSAAHAGAIVFYEEALYLVPYREGKLFNAIYRVFAEDVSTETSKLYEVSWNARKAPHGHLIENGWIHKSKDGALVQQLPVGFIRRAGDRSADAVKAMEQRVAERLAELLAKQAEPEVLPNAGERE